MVFELVAQLRGSRTSRFCSSSRTSTARSRCATARTSCAWAGWSRREPRRSCSRARSCTRTSVAEASTRTSSRSQAERERIGARPAARERPQSRRDVRAHRVGPCHGLQHHGADQLRPRRPDHDRRLRDVGDDEPWHQLVRDGSGRDPRRDTGVGGDGTRRVPPAARRKRRSRCSSRRSRSASSSRTPSASSSRLALGDPGAALAERGGALRLRSSSRSCRC